MVDEQTPAEGTEAETIVKSKPPIMIIVAAIGLCASAGAASFFAAPVFVGGEASTEDKLAVEAGEHETQDSHPVKESPKHDAKKEGSHGDARDHSDLLEGEASESLFHVAGDRAFFTPDPLVVSIIPNGRVRHLKIAIAVETDPQSESLYRLNLLRVRDVLTTYLRTLDPAVIEDPGSIDLIRAQLHRRIAVVVAPAPVNAVLITDFILS